VSKHDEEIKKKLAELEASIEEEPPTKLTVPQQSTQLTAPQADNAIRSDLFLIGGLGLLLTGVLMFLNHIKLTTGYISWLGFHGGGFGLILIPLLIGIGFLFYDYRNKVGWMITAASLALVIFAALAQVVMVFPTMSVLGVVIMLLPLAAGLALVLKSMSLRGSVRSEDGGQCGHELTTRK